MEASLNIDPLSGKPVRIDSMPLFEELDEDVRGAALGVLGQIIEDIENAENLEDRLQLGEWRMGARELESEVESLKARLLEFKDFKSQTADHLSFLDNLISSLGDFLMVLKSGNLRSAQTATSRLKEFVVEAERMSRLEVPEVGEKKAGGTNEVFSLDRLKGVKDQANSIRGEIQEEGDVGIIKRRVMEFLRKEAGIEIASCQRQLGEYDELMFGSERDFDSELDFWFEKVQELAKEKRSLEAEIRRTKANIIADQQKLQAMFGGLNCVSHIDHLETLLSAQNFLDRLFLRFFPDVQSKRIIKHGENHVEKYIKLLRDSRQSQGDWSVMED